MPGFVVGLIAALLAFAPLANAYVPPSFFVVRTLAKKHANIEELRIRTKISLYKRNGEIARTFNETLVMPDSDRVQVRLVDDTGSEIATKSRKLLGARAGDIDRPIAYDLLFVKDNASIFEHFKALGLPLKAEADLYAEKEGALPYKPETNVVFTRYENRIAVVVGEEGQKPDPTSRSTSLWVEKDSYLPLRAVFPSSPEAGMASEPLEYRMGSYQPYKNFLYPRVMQVFRNGSLWVKAETVDVRAGASGTLEEPKAKAELDSDTREFVETYFKWVR